MKKLILVSLLLFSFTNIFSQWSGDGYFLELPNGRIWGSYETVEDPGSMGGVFYRIIHSPQIVINARPTRRDQNGALILEWVQYRTYQNNWYPEWSGEMVVNEIMQPRSAIPVTFKDTLSPSRQLIQGAYFGNTRTLLKYVSGVPQAYETSWSPILFTINGGAANTTAFNPFNQLLDGYVISTKGNIHGDFVLYREPGGGVWGCMDGNYLYYYRSGGYYVTIICPSEYDMTTGDIIGFFNRYRVNASNLDRTRGIWKPTEWEQDLSGDIIITRTATRCPDYSPTTTPSGASIVGCLHATIKTNYRYSGNTPIEAREPWVPIIFTLTQGPTAPAQVTGDPCDNFCSIYCRKLGKTGGRYNGGTECLLGQVANASKGCDCW